MYEQSFETEFIVDDNDAVFNTEFVSDDELFDTNFISEDELFDTSFEADDQVFDTSFESDEQVFDTEFDAGIPGGEGGTCLPHVTKKDDGKVLKVQSGEWAVGEDEATPMSNMDIEILLRNFK